jgi:glycerol uptake facilitator-like aquaporin
MSKIEKNDYIRRSGAPLGNGLWLDVLVFYTAGISGGHLDPAVSTGLYTSGRLGM